MKLNNAGMLLWLLKQFTRQHEAHGMKSIDLRGDHIKT